uniref:Uncharacterized protein n=2 Tax=Triatoma infestans TaxID=30076 RepID=A0A023F9U4_TRIIF
MGTSGYVPSIESQMRYLVEWFREFSEMQRGDFLPVLVQKFGQKGYVNGLIPAMDSVSNLEDRPPSLFQCRLKLFNDWTETWGNGEKELLLGHIKAIDPSFSAKYDKEVNSINSSNNDETCSN